MERKTRSYAAPVFEGGSFRDIEGRVFWLRGRVFRTLSLEARERLSDLWQRGFVPALINDGLLIRSELTPVSSLDIDDPTLGEMVVEHEPIAPIICPSEFSFEMLRDGALLTLELLQRSVRDNLVLKDATGFNVQYHQGRMTFIDILSFDHLRAGQPWYAYAQFCREFLYPLMLFAYKGVDFQSWLRGSLDGIHARDMSALMNWRDVFRPGVIKHVKLQAKLEKSFSGKDVEIGKTFKLNAVSGELMLALAGNLRKIIDGLDGGRNSSRWSGYTDTCTYSGEETNRKLAFIDQALKGLKLKRIVDLGANTGEYSIAAAAHADQVVALDSDAGCIDRLYKSIKAGKVPAKVVPMVVDLLNPSPAMGWRHEERHAFLDRIDSDGFLALALVHHLRISGNIPFDRIVELLSGLGSSGVVEWVDKTDPMVVRMLRNRVDVFDDYSWDTFAACLGKQFVIRQTLEINNGTRILCFVTKPDDRPSAAVDASTA